MTFEIRDADENDINDIADLWYAGWHDAHASIVPAELVDCRTYASFVERSARHLQRTRLALSGRVISGLCMTRDDELFQLYVAKDARGTGLAQMLIADAENNIRNDDHSRAWLACAVGNQRAARFYEGRGWTMSGKEVEELETLDGSFPLEVWRFEKEL
ncbi:MAG: GNAT family N-acetyltransferase [Pseudomonadota bacterium]